MQRIGLNIGPRSYARKHIVEVPGLFNASRVSVSNRTARASVIHLPMESLYNPLYEMLTAGSIAAVQRALAMLVAPLALAMLSA